MRERWRARIELSRALIRFRHRGPPCFKSETPPRRLRAALEPVTGSDGVTRCAIVLDPTIVRTEAVPRRPFQGWRYLEAKDAPPDIAAGDPIADLPTELRRALSEVGVK